MFNTIKGLRMGIILDILQRTVTRTYFILFWSSFLSEQVFTGTSIQTVGNTPSGEPDYIFYMTTKKNIGPGNKMTPLAQQSQDYKIPADHLWFSCSAMVICSGSSWTQVLPFPPCSLWPLKGFNLFVFLLAANFYLLSQKQLHFTNTLLTPAILILSCVAAEELN